MYVLPHIMSNELKIEVDHKTKKTILQKFKISRMFLFYPAQFWPHKNHIRIFEAIRLLKSEGLDIQVVFTGSNKTIREKYNIEYILRTISKESNMKDNLIITGYLENDEIITFYKNALAMIMPQLIPEPCIPYVEAMRLGCPIIASDIPGIREQVSDSGILVNPYEIKSVADGIKKVINRNKREELIRRGFDNYKKNESNLVINFSKIKEIIVKQVFKS